MWVKNYINDFIQKGRFSRLQILFSVGFPQSASQSGFPQSGRQMAPRPKLGQVTSPIKCLKLHSFYDLRQKHFAIPSACQPTARATFGSPPHKMSAIK